MKKSIVAPKKHPALAPLTLADIRITWHDRDKEYAMSNHPPKPETYRVEISTPAKGGAR